MSTGNEPDHAIDLCTLCTELRRSGYKSAASMLEFQEGKIDYLQEEVRNLEEEIDQVTASWFEEMADNSSLKRTIKSMSEVS